MRVSIDKDEFWPWLIIEEGERTFGQEFRIDKRIVERYLLAQSVFLKAHEALAEAMEKVRS